ncbi:hypothetical protein AtNW77_Chr2g0224451 [Arabidopsis thaliana]
MFINASTSRSRGSRSPGFYVEKILKVSIKRIEKKKEVIIGYTFSNNKEVVDYVANISPLLSFILDGFTAVLNGVARGCGWQHIGALINVVAYYLVGAPVGVYLAFSREWNGKGLWCGVMVGSAVQATLLAIVTASMNWKEQAEKARKRIISTKNGLV